MGDIQVSGTLSIDPGVTVRFEGDYELLVGSLAQLRVNGSSANGGCVRFTPGGATPWKGIAFVNAAAGSFLNGAIVEGAHQSGIRITGTPLALTNCFIRNNSSTGNGGGILAQPGVSPASLVMEGCMINNNAASPLTYSGSVFGGGMYVEGSLLLFQSTVVSNWTGGSYGYAAGVCVLDGNCRMTNCTIAFNAAKALTGNSIDAVYFWGGATEATHWT
jgi:predicted outer membrane repeat protein